MNICYESDELSLLLEIEICDYQVIIKMFYLSHTNVHLFLLFVL